MGTPPPPEGMHAQRRPSSCIGRSERRSLRRELRRPRWARAAISSISSISSTRPLRIPSSSAPSMRCTPTAPRSTSGMSRRMHVLTTAPCPPPPHRYFQLQAPGPGLWSISLASGAELLSARHGAATGARHGTAVPGSRDAAPPARALPVPLLSYTGATLDSLVGACTCSPRRPPAPPHCRCDARHSRRRRPKSWLEHTHHRRPRSRRRPRLRRRRHGA
jgi:hypothetical protein